MKIRHIAAVATLAFASSALAEFPTKNVTFIAPFPPGGASDLVARAMSSGMEEALGVSVTVMNRAGAGGTVGAAAVASTDPDGYSIGILTTTPLLMSPLTTELPYSPKDFDYICRAFSNPLILTVKQGSALNTLDRFLDYARDSSNRVRYYTAAAGALQSVATEDFGAHAGFRAVAIPLRGDQPAVQNLMSGVIDVALLSSGVILSNKDTVMPVAVMAPERLDNLPDVPTFKELGFDLNYSLWGAIVTPKGVPAEARQKLEQACESAQGGDDFINVMRQFNMPVVYQPGAEFEQAFMAEIETTRTLLKEMGLID